MRDGSFLCCGVPNPKLQGRCDPRGSPKSGESHGLIVFGVVVCVCWSGDGDWTLHES